MEEEEEEVKTEARISIDDRVREWDYGAYEGLTSAQIRAMRKEQGIGGKEGEWDIWRDGCEGGEGPEE
ncbi:MAG: hypothetical protein Q9190_008153, partial [Brigantiaea leucoxantha]